MLSQYSRARRATGLVLLGLVNLLAQSSAVQAGGFFHRMFYRQQCQQCYQQPVQAAPATTQAPAGSYQSNSFEPGAAVAAPATVAPRYNSPSSNRSSYEQFRGDRKALGRY